MSVGVYGCEKGCYRMFYSWCYLCITNLYPSIIRVCVPHFSYFTMTQTGMAINACGWSLLCLSQNYIVADVPITTKGTGTPESQDTPVEVSKSSWKVTACISLKEYWFWQRGGGSLQQMREGGRKDEATTIHAGVRTMWQAWGWLMVIGVWRRMCVGGECSLVCRLYFLTESLSLFLLLL